MSVENKCYICTGDVEEDRTAINDLFLAGWKISATHNSSNMIETESGITVTPALVLVFMRDSTDRLTIALKELEEAKQLASISKTYHQEIEHQKVVTQRLEEQRTNMMSDIADLNDKIVELETQVAAYKKNETYLLSRLSDAGVKL